MIFNVFMTVESLNLFSIPFYGRRERVTWWSRWPQPATLMLPRLSAVMTAVLWPSVLLMTTQSAVEWNIHSHPSAPLKGVLSIIHVCPGASSLTRWEHVLLMRTKAGWNIQHCLVRLLAHYCRRREQLNCLALLQLCSADEKLVLLQRPSVRRSDMIRN